MDKAEQRRKQREVKIAAMNAALEKNSDSTSFKGFSSGKRTIPSYDMIQSKGLQDDEGEKTIWI
ncbi:unnamed protein product [Ilex paraguariensis]|uniref:Uncharacterized protein n=1 Tax=Ilex paraguariensis TaxID=185542 RepID=A0ABC8QL23_9AQUA